MGSCLPHDEVDHELVVHLQDGVRVSLTVHACGEHVTVEVGFYLYRLKIRVPIVHRGEFTRHSCAVSNQTVFDTNVCLPCLYSDAREIRKGGPTFYPFQKDTSRSWTVRTGGAWFFNTTADLGAPPPSPPSGRSILFFHFKFKQ